MSRVRFCFLYCYCIVFIMYFYRSAVNKSWSILNSVAVVTQPKEGEAGSGRDELREWHFLLATRLRKKRSNKCDQRRSRPDSKSTGFLSRFVRKSRTAAESTRAGAGARIAVRRRAGKGWPGCAVRLEGLASDATANCRSENLPLPTNEVCRGLAAYRCGAWALVWGSQRLFCRTALDAIITNSSNPSAHTELSAGYRTMKCIFEIKKQSK